MFLNTFLVLSKKTKLEEPQILDLLYEKLSDKFKNLLVTKKKQTNLDDLIKKLCSMDASMKIINQRKRATPAVNTPKPTYQHATRFVPQTTRFAPVAPAAVTTTTFTLPSTATGTHAGPMDVSSVRQGPLSAEKKERRNKLGLCRYCGQPGHIAMDHKDPSTLQAKRRAAGIHEMTMALSSNNTPTPSNTMAMSENTLSPSTVALGDLLD